MKTKTNTVEGFLGKTFSKIESTLSTKLKVVIGLAVITIGTIGVFSLIGENDVTANSVKIIAMSGRSGGSGVVYKSTTSGTEILTNAHVCALVEKGALVEAKGSFYLVTGYKKSNYHDLCMVTISKDLGIDSSIASQSPTAYYEKALISGHPALLPNVVTSGHFSGTKVISVLTRFKECQEYDGPVCKFFNVIPIIKRYESTLVTATIMPGSSGSGVYNSNMQLVGLAFAGSGNLGYAWTVPYEYLRYFVDKEQYELEYQLPQTSVEYKNLRRRTNAEHFKRILKVCEEKKDLLPKELKEVCQIVQRDILYR